MPNRQPTLPIGEAVLKGLLVGGSLGTFAGWFFAVDTPRAVMLGIICGFAAGITSWRIQKSRDKRRR